MLVYKSRSHSKTIELVQDVINEANRLRVNNKSGLEHISITKTPMSEYHLGYIIEKLESEEFKVEFSQGINQFHLHISWDNVSGEEKIINKVKEMTLRQLMVNITNDCQEDADTGFSWELTIAEYLENLYED